MNAVAYGNGQFVGVYSASYNDTDNLLSSSDGITWISRTHGTTYYLWGVNYVNGQFMALGGSIISSIDGISWGNVVASTDNNIISITYGNGRLVAVGQGGTIITN